jgi:hypothetical protein
MSDINEPLQTAGRDDYELVLEAIEALKRWIYRADYKGPEKDPEPKTETEFSVLMDGLRRWATLYSPHIDTGRLQDYRRAELSLATCTPVRAFPDQRGQRDWSQTAAKADDALNEMKIQLGALLDEKARNKKLQLGDKDWGALAERAVALAIKVPEFASEMQHALEYVTSDPPSSLTKSRIVLEKMLLVLYRSAMKKEPKRAMIVEMLSDKVFTATIPRRFLARMTAVRDMSNLGAHGEPVEPMDASRVLSDLLELLDWFVLVK